MRCVRVPQGVGCGRVRSHGGDGVGEGRGDVLVSHLQRGGRPTTTATTVSTTTTSATVSAIATAIATALTTAAATAPAADRHATSDVVERWQRATPHAPPLTLPHPTPAKPLAAPPLGAT